MNAEDRPQDDEPLVGDRALLRAFRDGERDALSTVFRFYAPRLARRLRGGVVVRVEDAPTRLATNLSHGDLEALIQEVFLRAFQPQARSKYDGERPYLTLLTAIARNHLIDEVRKQRRRRTSVVEDIEAAVPAEEIRTEPSLHPLWQIEQSRLRDALDEVLSHLPAREQEVFRLRFVTGRTLQETAEEMRVSLSTVRRTESKLRQTLLEQLQERGYLRDREVVSGSGKVARRTESEGNAPSDASGAG